MLAFTGWCCVIFGVKGDYISSEKDSSSVMVLWKIDEFFIFFVRMPFHFCWFWTCCKIVHQGMILFTEVIEIFPIHCRLHPNWTENIPFEIIPSWIMDVTQERDQSIPRAHFTASVFIIPGHRNGSIHRYRCGGGIQSSIFNIDFLTNCQLIRL